MDAKDRLNEIAQAVQAGTSVNPVTVRSFLAWFGAQRRSYWNVERVRRSLSEVGLETTPDFESAYIDSEINFQRASSPTATLSVETVNGSDSIGGVDVASLEGSASSAGFAATDPTYRISKLEAANIPPTSIAPDKQLSEAFTIMMAKDFSQLPVMSGDRNVKGVVSWTSVGQRMALGKDCRYVRDAMDQHQEVRADASMFQAISTISEYGYVLVRNNENRITGIVTASDLNFQFQQLAEPFLLLGEIENHVRALLDGKFRKEELAGAKFQGDDRQVDTVSDLTFGEYLRLLETDESWSKISVPLDRRIFCNQLDEIRKIRNDVMHFDPDGVPKEDLKTLREFAQFLRRLRSNINE